MLSTKKCHCPYCGEPIELVIDPSEEEQEYIEDCFVCCRPIVVNTYAVGDEVSIEVRSENDA